MEEVTEEDDLLDECDGKALLGAILSHESIDKLGALLGNQLLGLVLDLDVFLITREKKVNTKEGSKDEKKKMMT